MFRTVIADDERSIVDLIKTLIKCPEVCVVGEAYNGIDAFSVVCREKPDILIADIRMPGATGIELIEKVKKDDPDIEIIVISGYRDFEYAHSALKFGVSEYLLKPVKEAELNGALKKIIEKGKGKDEEQKKIREIEKKLDKSIHALRKDYIAESITNQFPQKYCEGVQGSELFSFETGIYCAAVMKIDACEWAEISPAQMKIVLENTCEKALSILKMFCHDSEYMCRDMKGYFLLNHEGSRYRSGTSPGFRKAREQLKSMLINERYKYEFLKFTFAFGEEAESAAGFQRSFQTVEQALENRINTEDVLIEWQLLPPGFLNRPQKWFSGEDEAALSDALRRLNTDEAVSLISGVLSRCVEQQRGYSCIYPISRAVAGLMAHVFPEEQSTDEEQKEIDLRARERLENTGDFEVAKEELFEYVKKTISFRREKQNSRDSQPIRAIKRYIEEKYASSITLEEVAGLVFLSPVYVSAAFKKQAGMSFTNYLIKTRIEKAKEFLRNSFFNVTEIAQMVGYSDAKHFSKLFKKVVGVTPAEYRKFYT